MAMMKSLPSFLRRIAVVVGSGLIAYLIALAPQRVWAALIVTNLKTSPSIPWSVPSIAVGRVVNTLA